MHPDQYEFCWRKMCGPGGGWRNECVMTKEIMRSYRQREANVRAAGEAVMAKIQAAIASE